MDREQLMQILPHRDGMLLLDQLDKEGEMAHGQYHVRGDEWFLQGHFPGNPVVPGVILCEMMAQATCVLLSESLPEGSTPYFTSPDKVKFKNPVRPGDTLETECVITKSKGPFYFASGKGYVNGKLSVSGDFSFAVVRK